MHAHRPIACRANCPARWRRPSWTPANRHEDPPAGWWCFAARSHRSHRHRAVRWPMRPRPASHSPQRRPTDRPLCAWIALSTPLESGRWLALFWTHQLGSVGYTSLGSLHKSAAPQAMCTAERFRFDEACCQIARCLGGALVACG